MILFNNRERLIRINNNNIKNKLKYNIIKQYKCSILHKRKDKNKDKEKLKKVK